jgi:hypothetical protein
MTAGALLLQGPYGCRSSRCPAVAGALLLQVAFSVKSRHDNFKKIVMVQKFGENRNFEAIISKKTK